MSRSDAPASDGRRWRPTRRGFLIATGLSGGGLAIGLGLGLPALRLRIAEGLSDSPVGGDQPRDPAAWFELLPDGRLRLHLNKVEMGQGVHTALAQVVADELELPLDRLELVQATTEHGPADPFGTAGSTSVAALWLPLREAAASLRELLRERAAAQLDLPAESLVARHAGFQPADGSATPRIDYATLLAGADLSTWELPEAAPRLKPAAEFTLIGEAVPRIDLPAKVDGSARFAYDVRLPGMAYGAVARPPMLGARLRGGRAGKAAEQPGVLTVLIEPGFAGVVAESRAAAGAALAQLELDWSPGRAWQQAEIEALLKLDGSGGVTIQRAGRAARHLADAADAASGATVIEAEYATPMAAHMPMEPQAALVDVQPDRVEAWVGTQLPDMLRGRLAKLLDLDEAQVNIHTPYLGGGFGRKFGEDVAGEAARLSRAAGRPVHVGWDRAEELREGYVRPPSRHRLRARLGPDGRIEALEHRQASGEVAFGFLPGFVAAMMGADFGATRGARLHYTAIPHRLVRAWVQTLPIRTGWWRGLGLLPNTFAIESFVDELAAQAGADPLRFRLDHLADDPDDRRMRAVLEAAAELGGWDAATPTGRARGIACCDDNGTLVAQVVELGRAADGGPQVHRVACAVDCGRVVNPDGAAAQVEGCIVMGLSSVLLEDLRVADGRVVAGNFDRYPILDISQTPAIALRLLDSPIDRPLGLGEPPIGPIGAAVANAWFALTGERIRRLPLRSGAEARSG
ncbi:MAG: xanthine dehydrogenase family protein molybdopterin-binding subunit [Caldilineae bacterium]|nr:xanthine dehydrogenase family protein molybdopterin-binding subunit [Caldilineae bacterium]